MKKNQIDVTCEDVLWSQPDNTSVPDNFVQVNPELVLYLKARLKKLKAGKNYLDHYLYICHAITHQRMTNKKLSLVEYINLNYKTLIRVISKYKYKEIISNLVEWNILKCDDLSRLGVKSKGYKLLSPYDSNIKSREIKDRIMNRKLNEFKSTMDSTFDEYSPAYQYLRTNIHRIKIDKRKAINYNKKYYLNYIKPKTYNYNFCAINCISERKFRFFIDTTGYRAHTNLTNLKKELRQFLRVDGEKLGEVDVSNAQPLFFYMHIRDISEIPLEEKQGYREIVENGRFYEFFMERLNIPKQKRDVVKRRIIAAIFFDYNHKIESRYVKVLKEEFPYIAQYIYEEKRKSHSKLAIMLQRAESNFIIEKAVNEFVNRFGDNYVFVSTIHDSIVAKVSQLENVKNVMEYCFEKEGLNPKLSISYF